MRRYFVRTAVLSLLLPACADDGPVDPEPIPGRVPTSIEVVSGNDQSGRVTEPLPEPIVVRVLDQDGEPMAGVAVHFRPDVNDGQFLDAEVETDASGLAQATWVVGTVAHVTLNAQAQIRAGDVVLDMVALRAGVRPGAAESLAIIGDTIHEIERGDTLFAHVRGYDAFGNGIHEDSLDVVWVTSDVAVASVEGHAVVGESEGDVVVTATTGVGSARLHVSVEGTVSVRYRMSDGFLSAGNGRLFYLVGGALSDSLYEWNGSAWEGWSIELASGYMWPIRNRVSVAPDGEFWGSALVSCSGCPGNQVDAVIHSTDGVAWDRSIDFGATVNIPPRLAFDGAGAPVVLAHDPISTGTPWTILRPKVLRYVAGAWQSLDLPYEIAADTVFVGSGIAVAANGDIYVTGGAMHINATSAARGEIARWDGVEWSFLSPAAGTPALGMAESSASGVYTIASDRLLRISGGEVERVATPLDGSAYTFDGLAISAAGDVAITYSGAVVSGAMFQTADRWEQWEADFGVWPRRAPAWHDGRVWLVMSLDGRTYVARLEPEE